MWQKLRKIGIIICGCVFLLSATQLCRYYLQYRAADKIYSEARAYRVEVSGQMKVEEERFVVDFEQLSGINQDVFGWILIEDTPIDYPLLLSSDNQDYLYRTYNGQSSGSGSIFLDKDCNSSFDDSHSILYGHNMKNGSMFASLLSYQKQEYLEAHPTVEIYLPDGVLTYQIFSAYTANVFDDTYKKVFSNENQFLDMIDLMQAQSVITTDVLLNSDSKIITLSTCTANSADTYRFVVNAVLIEDTREK